MSNVVLKQNDDGSMGLQGDQRDHGAFIPVSLDYQGLAADASFCTMNRPMRVLGIIGRVDVISTGAATVTIRKVASGVALASGTALHTGTFNGQGTATNNQTLTLASATDGTLDLSAGDSLAADISATLAGGTGNITVWLAPR